MTWAEMKMENLRKKGRDNWDQDDYETACYCEECFAEEERDNEYLDVFGIVY